MSRTKKDQPDRVRFPENFDSNGRWKRSGDTEITKKRKEVDTEWHWMSTPSWWVNLTMTRPQRKEAQIWEQEVKKIQNPEELEEVDTPNVSKKPHKYYW